MTFLPRGYECRYGKRYETKKSEIDIRLIEDLEKIIMKTGDILYVIGSIIIVAYLTNIIVGIVGITLFILLIRLNNTQNRRNKEKIEKLFHGKISIFSNKANNIENPYMAKLTPPSVYEFEQIFPLEMKASKDEEPNLVISLIWYSEQVGSYTSGNPAYRLICEMHVFSRELNKKLKIETFYGTAPPEKIYGYGRHNNFNNFVSGDYPSEKVKNHLREIRELIKKN